MTAVAEFLTNLHLDVTVVGSSPLKRALETAEIVARKLRSLNKLEEWPELRPTGDSGILYQKLSRVKLTQQVLLVGHEPNFTSMIAEIIAGKTGVNLVLKKGGLAKVRITSFKPAISGELRWILTPKLMKKMA
jgi:phosphohistidine phosphatase